MTPKRWLRPLLVLFALLITAIVLGPTNTWSKSEAGSSGGEGTYQVRCEGTIASIKDDPENGSCVFTLSIGDDSRFTELHEGDMASFKFTYLFDGHEVGNVEKDVGAKFDIGDKVAITFTTDTQDDGSYPGTDIEMAQK